MSFKLQFFKFFKFLLANFLRPFITFLFSLYYKNIDKPRPLPPLKSEFLELPAHELAERIRSRKVTSLAVVTAYIDRIKEIQPLVNCVVKTCYDEAIEEAKRVDKLLSEKTNDELETFDNGRYSKENAPLLGVPFSCKESIWVKGMPNSAGLYARKDEIAKEDNDVVKNVRNAGAILTCVTNTSEVINIFLLL